VQSIIWVHSDGCHRMGAIGWVPSGKRSRRNTSLSVSHWHVYVTFYRKSHSPALLFQYTGSGGWSPTGGIVRWIPPRGGCRPDSPYGFCSMVWASVCMGRTDGSTRLMPPSGRLRRHEHIPIAWGGQWEAVATGVSLGAEPNRSTPSTTSTTSQTKRTI